MRQIACSPEQLRERLDDIVEYRCGCDKEALKLSGLAFDEIVLAMTEGDDGDEIFSATDSSRLVIARTDAGKIVTWTESEDYSGHGCQCGADAGIWPNLDAALRLGLNADERAEVALVGYDAQPPPAGERG